MSPLSKLLLRFDLAAHVTNQCSQRPILCKYCFSPFAFVHMEKHVEACHSNNKSNGNIIGDKSIAGNSDPALWKSERKCPYGCPGRWNNPESLEAHKKEASHQHLEYLNKRVVRLEILNKENDMNTLMVGSQQQPSSPPLENETEDMDETGPEMSQQRSQQVEYLVAFYATLHPALLSRQLVGWSVSLTLDQLVSWLVTFYFFMILFL